MVADARFWSHIHKFFEQKDQRGPNKMSLKFQGLCVGIRSRSYQVQNRKSKRILAKVAPKGQAKAKAGAAASSSAS